MLARLKVIIFMTPLFFPRLPVPALFVFFNDFLTIVAEKLAEANKLADALAQKLEQSEMARKKADLDASRAKAEAEEAIAKASGVEDLQKRLADAEAALNEHKASQAAREKAITKRLLAQNRRFVGNFVVTFYLFLFYD
jgi:uncharacterized protein YlxW (UPF0749 family)